MLKIAAVLAALFPLAAFAADPAFTPAQRDEIISIVRNALKADPSILREAVVSLQSDDDAKANAEAQAAITTHHKDLVARFGDAETGNANGDVTVVEFYDPRCPYCRKMLPGIDALLQKDHGIRLVFKDIPVLGPASTLEAKAIVAAQKQGGYLKLQHALMSNPAQPDDAMIAETAKSVGLDGEKLLAEMRSKATTERLQANLDLAHALKVNGTPTFVVGDMIIPGMVDAGQLEEAVVAARKHAGQ
jgi:protein-disulfide isomerase